MAGVDRVSHHQKELLKIKKSPKDRRSLKLGSREIFLPIFLSYKEGGQLPLDPDRRDSNE